ncbi:translation initiation factor IF-2 [Listeria newyorkensis]|uniref:Translation initiation factor IF-2 n=1 Tax=Listeria newyorkensis TaxID=1497681 RepID=A0ABX4XPR2_9LIST|nr:translation initiation factor IF-2 [Listeria newyorkensis]KGL45173.1 translation initiation factor IF-2 [Listeriaceae bacterium FSL A5-0209]KGL40067.1 translation initiation factor IF-2 [Listeria newyorkensis]PNP93348.1 translation initiation factor IF-2 [Listeria newyorkensis]WAO21208.1 translation initiation factor IF-2 [Listeria newyorkensis]SQC55750.1 Translation initiation factor IF-2 [Listeria newyorkensis]
MSKVRVYEYAKEHQLPSKKVIETLQELGVEVANHMSTINDNALRQLDKTLLGPKKESAAPSSQPKASNEAGQSKGSNKPNMNDKSNQSKPTNNTNKPASQGAAKPAASGNKPAGGATQGGQNRPNNSGGQNRPGGNAQGGGNRNQGGNRNNQNRGRKNNTKYKGKRNHSTVPPTPPKPKELPEKIVFSESLTVGELARKLYREPSEIIKKLFLLGVVATINQGLEKDAIELVCGEYGVEVEEEIKIDITDLDVYFEEATEEDKGKEVERPAVVTIMGHVDHGKTTLLDSLRNTKVTLGEAGGITQHIGAYQLEVHNKKITFLDTPGHAAFTTMRARGAKITDITILVVAADDGVMPQTIEAINHAKAAEVPIIVAVNKIDKPQANADRVMQELTEYELVPEAWGGDTIFVPISAKFGEGLDTLLEMILLVSEVEELKANPDRLAIGSVIEAELDKGRGSVATLLVQDGTLNVGDPIVVGNTFGRVRAMVNDIGRRVKKVGPSTPVEITGLSDVPQAGDRFVVFEDEKTARAVGEARSSRAVVAQRSATNRVSLENLFEHMKAGEMKEVNVIIKADVQGSVEALAASLRKIEVEGVNVKIIHTSVGAINESDITLASASNAIVIGFNVRPTTQAREGAENEGVDIRLHRVIYKAIDEIEAAMKGMLDPEFQEKIIGQAQVRQTISVSKVGTIAGCYVTDGKITRDSGVRVIRDGIVVFEGEIGTLKRFKDDAKEVAKGFECGITIDKFNDIKEDDVIEAYIMEEIERK